MSVHLEKRAFDFQVGIFDMRGATCCSDMGYPVRKPGLNFWTWGFCRSEADRKPVVAWVDQLLSATAKYAYAVYVNNLDADEGEARIRSAFGASYKRLFARKNNYAPTNFFRMNQNIKPTA